MAERARVIVLSASFGGGHTASAEAIRGYFKSRHGAAIDVEVIDFFERFAPSLSVLARFAFQQPEEFFPAFFGDFGQMLAAMPDNPIVHELKVSALAKLREFLEQEAPAAVISTFPAAGSAVAQVKSAESTLAATLILSLDGRSGWLHPGTDFYFVPTQEVREQLAVRGAAWDKTVISGVPLREQFAAGDLSRAQCRERMGLSDRFTVLLTSVFQAPADVVELAVRMVEAGVQVALVAGTNEKLQKKADLLGEKMDMLKVYGFVEDMNTMMRAANVVVGRAGELTLFEALAVGLPPLVCAPLPGQQIHAVDFLVNSGAGLLSRDEGDVVEKVRFLSSHPERLQQLSENAAGLGRPMATQAVCERVVASM